MRKNILSKRLGNLILFYGSLEEYERWKGYKCEIIAPSYEIPECDEDNYDDELGEEDVEMAKKGIEAVVNVQDFPRTTHDSYYHPSKGLPVRKKKK